MKNNNKPNKPSKSNDTDSTSSTSVGQYSHLKLRYKDVKEFAPLDMESGIDLKTKQIVLADDLAPDGYELRPKCKFCNSFKLKNENEQNHQKQDGKNKKKKSLVGQEEYEDYHEKGAEGICLVSKKLDKNGKIVDLTYEETPVFNCKDFQVKRPTEDN